MRRKGKIQLRERVKERSRFDYLRCYVQSEVELVGCSTRTIQKRVTYPSLKMIGSKQTVSPLIRPASNSSRLLTSNSKTLGPCPVSAFVVLRYSNSSRGRTSTDGGIWKSFDELAVGGGKGEVEVDRNRVSVGGEC